MHLVTPSISVSAAVAFVRVVREMVIQKVPQVVKAVEVNFKKEERGREGAKEASPRKRFLFWLKENPRRRRPNPFLEGLEPCVAVPCQQRGRRSRKRLKPQRSLGLDLLDVFSVCLLNGHLQAAFHPLPSWFNCFQAGLNLVPSPDRGVVAARDPCGSPLR
jgi:hypothetical protein